MRERVRDKGRLEDILEFSNNVTNFIENVTYEEFVNNKQLFYAVMKNVEVVGEAAFMLTKAFKTEHPDTPWSLIQGMRHVLVHDYANVIPKILWRAAKKNIPELTKQVKHYLQETDWNKWVEDEDLFEKLDNASFKTSINTARRMKDDGMTTEQIEKYTGLTKEEIEDL